MSFLARRLPFHSLPRRLWRFAISAEYRYDAVWRLLARPAGMFQPYGTTFVDRYPEQFALSRHLVPDGPDRHLLSFGCATGEEVFTLRQYFPQASITGIDINPRRIRLSRRALRRRGGDRRIAFAVAHSAERCVAASFDAVYCMAVFRHEKLKINAAPRCDHLIRFADFERALTGLARCLKPGGLLVLRHANFRFRDTALAGHFEVVGRLSQCEVDAAAPLYDREDRLIPGGVEDQAIFRLRSVMAAPSGPAPVAERPSQNA